MVKVLMVGNHPSVKGGITTVIKQFTSYNWNKEGIELKFIPTYVDKNTFFKILFFIISYIKIFIFLLYKRPNVIHIHMSYKGSFTRAYLIQRLSKIYKIKNIIHLHGSEFEKWYKVCNNKKREKIKKLLKDANYFIVLGKEWKDKIKKIEPTTKIIIANNAVKIPKETTSWNKEKFTFLFLGVLIKRKGVYDLLEAIYNLKEQNKIENTQFIIAGTGKEEATLKVKAKKLEIDKYINFFGWVDGLNKVKLLKNCQAMILPSYNEGLPMSILEAISYGMPIIATNVGDIEEAVINNKNGYIIETGNIKELEEAILNIKNANEEQWLEYSQKSKNIAKEKFSEANYFKKFKKLYMNLS